MIFAPIVTFAHPGGTASDGCHYCRTNCYKWGEIANQRHCHNSKAVPMQTEQPPDKPDDGGFKTPIQTREPEGNSGGDNQWLTITLSTLIGFSLAWYMKGRKG